MKTIKFRPLRRIKKTGKITVASYMQWRKVKTADYNTFQLIVDDEYKSLPKDELVYNRNGENLFWRNFNPENIPTLPPYILRDEKYEYPKQWKTNYDMGYCDHFSARGLDCDGVPTFSHFTADDIFNSKADMADFEPLTVEIVTWWFGWFLYQLTNSKLIVPS